MNWTEYKILCAQWRTGFILGNIPDIEYRRFLRRMGYLPYDIAAELREAVSERDKANGT